MEHRTCLLHSESCSVCVRSTAHVLRVGRAREGMSRARGRNLSTHAHMRSSRTTLIVALFSAAGDILHWTAVKTCLL